MSFALPTGYFVMLGFAIVCGGLIGLERQLRGKPAGIRTSILICVSTAAFTRLGSETAANPADTLRIVGQVIVGVGFVGAGVMFTRGDTVAGVTSASVIWLLAAIGVHLGLGEFSTAIALTATGLCVLGGVEWLERVFVALRRGVHATREIASRLTHSGDEEDDVRERDHRQR